MKKKSRHKKKIELLRELVGKTDFYVAHVWNVFGSSIHGYVNCAGRQKFRRFGDCSNEWFTPWLGHFPHGEIYFAVMPRTIIDFGTVLVGWNELKWFVREEIAKKDRNEKNKLLM